MLGVWHKLIFDGPARPAKLSSPIVQSGSVFVLTDSGRLMAFDLIGSGMSDAANGVGEAWAQQPRPEREVGLGRDRFDVPHVSLVSHEDQLYVASEHGGLWQIDPQDLSTQRHFSPDLPPVSTPIVWARGTCFCGSRDGDLVAMRLTKSGKLLVKRIALGDIAPGSIGAVGAGEQHLFWPGRGRLIRLNLQLLSDDGHEWARSIEAETMFESDADILAPTPGADCIYLADRRGTVYRIDGQAQVSQHAMDGRVYSAPCWDGQGQHLVVQTIRDDRDVQICFLDAHMKINSVLPHTGTRWQEPRTELLFIADTASPRHDMLVYGVSDPNIGGECLSAVLLGGQARAAGAPRPSQPVEGELTRWLAHASHVRMLFATTTRGGIYAFQICEA
jgi:hypothetical protein